MNELATKIPGHNRVEFGIVDSNRWKKPLLAGLLGALAFCPHIATPQQQPLVGWGVHTVVSSEIPNRHRLVRRAILVWGETWPSITIEIVDWRAGMGGQRLVASKRIPVEGQNPVCPDPAESWCGQLGGLDWQGTHLVHHFEAHGTAYICDTPVSDHDIGTTRCWPAA